MSSLPPVRDASVAKAPLRPRLLIVEDEPELAEVFGELFADGPWVATVCGSASEATARMADGVDVLLTDKNLPDGSGLDLIEVARGFCPDVEVVLITGFASLDTAIEAIQRGVFDYIVKPPPSVFDVRRKVEQAFARQRVLRENQRLLAELEDRNERLERALGELERTRDELVQTEKLAGLGTFAAGIAHEIGSPLFGVMGLAEAIEDEDDGEVVRGHAREIVRYATSIKHILADVGTYARPSDPERCPVDVPEEARAAVRMVERSPGPPVNLSIDLPDGTPWWLRPTALQQVLVNLLVNARQAMVESGALGGVDVSVRADGGTLEVRVRDRGPGISDRLRDRIFEPFFTTKEPGKGTGLGLHVVYRIVTRHQGTVKVVRPRGGGAEFVVRWPRGDVSPDTGR